MRSKILDRKGRLEMGRKLLGFSGSRPGFLSIGVIAATLKAEGTVPEVREEFMMAVMSGLRQVRQCLTSADGIGSNRQVVRWILLKCLVISISVMTDREGRVI